MADTSVTELFKTAVTSYGKNYLDAEQALRAGGTATATELQKIQADTSQTPLTRFIAGTIADWANGKGGSFDAALKTLANVQTRASKTPRNVPLADTAAAKLQLFDDIENFLALRMLKEIDWPAWQVMAAIVYLGYWGTSSVIPALYQFQADLKSGMRTGLGDQMGKETAAVIDRLNEAASLVLLVINDETFKTDIAKVKSAQGDRDGEDEAAQIAIAQAISLLYTDQDNAQKIDQAIADIRTNLLDPILEATKGDLTPKYVRSILAQYVLGVDDSTPQPQTDHTQSTQADTSGTDGDTTSTNK